MELSQLQPRVAVDGGQVHQGRTIHGRLSERLPPPQQAKSLVNLPLHQPVEGQEAQKARDHRGGAGRFSDIQRPAQCMALVVHRRLYRPQK
jgi:hypothetical protein